MNSQEVLNKKGFCILPFVHSCIWQNGNVQPCCINNLSLGNVKTNSLEDIYSSKNETLIDFRKEFLTDKLHGSCYKCQEIEDKYDANSYRIDSNKEYGYLLDYIDISSEEALINNDKLLLWDIRFSNLCNLKCLICRPDDSSRIAEEEEQGQLISSFDDVDEFITYFEKHIYNVVEIYFVGGEPMLIKEHYKILELLIKYKKFNVVLRYNTNGTTINLGNKNITEYWKYFKKVRLSVSLDAGWEQFEYIRFGSTWDTVLNNLRTIRSETPHVLIRIGIVITILNIFHIRRLYEFLLKEDIFLGNDMYFMNVYGKDYYRPNVLPADLKEKALQYYQEWEESLDRPLLIESIRFIKNLIKDDTDTSGKLSQLKERTLLKDAKRHTDFFKTFPELKDIFNDVQ